MTWKKKHKKTNRDRETVVWVVIVVGAPEADPLSTIQTLFLTYRYRYQISLLFSSLSCRFHHQISLFFMKRKQTQCLWHISLCSFSPGSSFSYHGFLRDSRYSDSCGCSSGSCSHCCCCFLYLFLQQTQRFDLLLLAFTLLFFFFWTWFIVSQNLQILNSGSFKSF